MLVELIPGETPWIQLTAESHLDAHRLGMMEERLGREGFELWTGDGGTNLVHLAIRPMRQEEEKLLRVEGPTRRLVEKHDRLLHFVRRLECSCSLDRCAPQCERCQVLADVTTWKPGEDPRAVREGEDAEAQ